MTLDIETTTRIVAHTCGGCGIVFGMPEWLNRRARAEGRSWRCVNPDCTWPSASYTETELTRTKAALEQAQRWSQNNRERAERAERCTEVERHRAAGLKGALTKARKRVGRGVCPCCNRSFAALARHMQTKHPTYKNGEP